MSLELAFVLAAVLSDPRTAVDAAHLRAAGAPPLVAVLHDADEDGTLYAAGADYKMIFGAGGARYIPALGARAPRNSEMRFSVAGGVAAMPQRDGDRIRYERGAFVEIYDLGLHAVEQSFLLRAPLATTMLRIDVDTDVVYGGRDANGLRFDAQGLATIRYGDVTLIDRHGIRAAAVSRFHGGAIEIDLPQGWSDAERYPIVVDPVIETFTIDGGSDQAKFPDVAYAPPSNVYQVSYLREYSAADADVFAARIDVCGDALETIALDLGTKNAQNPRVAFSGSHFMTVWGNFDVDSGFYEDEVEARARVAGSTAVAAKFRVSNALNLYPGGAAIGGGGVAGSFLVAYHEFQLGSWRLLGRIVNAAGNVSGTFVIDGTTNAENAAISPTPNSAGRWLVAYTRRPNFGPFNLDLYARQVNTSAAVVGNAIAIATDTVQYEQHAAVATDGTNFFVVCDVTVSGAGNDIVGRGVTSGANPVAGPFFNLSVLEPGVDPSRHQTEPAISFDGVRYALAYAESVHGSVNIEIRGATFFAGQSLTFQEGHVLVPGPGMTNLRPRIAGAGFDRPGQHLIAWRQRNLSTQDQDARGALWSTLQSGGGVTILDTGCGGPGAEPLLLTSSVPALGTSCSVTLLNFHAPLLGFGAPSVLPPCAGTSCSFGLGATTYLTAPSTTFTFQIGTSPTLLGTQLALQGLDYLPPANATEVCPSTGSTSFTTSDTIVFTVQ